MTINSLVNFYTIRLFILSEFLIFVTVFWIYLHNSMVPSIYLGNIFPSSCLVLDSYSFLKFSLYLSFNLICLRSYLYLLMLFYKIKYKFYLILNILLTILVWNILFIFFQFLEYARLYFSIFDTIYGSCFFIITGLHLLHMIIGAIITIYLLSYIFL